MVQWLGLGAFTAIAWVQSHCHGLGSIPGWEPRSWKSCSVVKNRNKNWQGCGETGTLLRCFGCLEVSQEVKHGVITRACVLSRFSHVWIFVIPWPEPHQAPLSVGLSWQEHWSGLPFPPPDPGTEPAAPALQADSLLLSHQGSPGATIPNQKFYSKKSENVSPYKNLSMNIHSSIIHKSQKVATHLSTDAWIIKMCYTHTREYYSAIKRNVMLIHTTTQMNLENIILSEKSHMLYDSPCTHYMKWL